MPKQSVITGAVALLISQSLILILGYAAHLWIGRVLGPAAYGIYGVILSIQTIVGLLLTLGIPMAVARFVAQDEEHSYSILRSALRLQYFLALVLTASALVTSPLIAALLGDQGLTPYIQFVSLVLLFQAAYPVYVQYFSGLHRFNRQALLTGIYAIIKFLGAISLLGLWRVYGAFAGFALGGVVASALGWFWTRRHRQQARVKLPLRSFLTFAGTYVLTLLGLQLLISLDLFMVKAFSNNDTSVGYYNAAVTLSRISYLLLQALTFVLLPSVSALTRAGKSRDEAVTFISDTLRYLIILVVPSITVAATTSQNLILLFFSAQYLPAAPVLTILMIGVGSLAFFNLLVTIVAGAGQARVSLGITIGLLGISTLLGIVLIPRYGLIGAAWQTTLTGVIGLTILTLYTFKNFTLPLPITTVLRVITASAVTVVPTYFWKPGPFFLPFQYMALGVFYLLLLYLLGEVKSHDRQRFAKIHPFLSWLKP